MLSNTAEMNPSPSVVCQEARGSFSTGTIDAQVTSPRRKVVPWKVSGSTCQSGARSGAAARMAPHTPMPISGHASRSSGYRRLAITLARMADNRMRATMNTRAHSMRTSAGAFLGGGDGAHDERHTGGDEGLKH